MASPTLRNLTYHPCTKLAKSNQGSSGKASDQPSFVGIVSFHGDDRIMSVLRGGEPDFEEFNLSSLYQMSQDQSTITAVTWIRFSHTYQQNCCRSLGFSELPNRQVMETYVTTRSADPLLTKHTTFLAITHIGQDSLQTLNLDFWASLLTPSIVWVQLLWPHLVMTHASWITANGCTSVSLPYVATLHDHYPLGNGMSAQELWFHHSGLHCHQQSDGYRRTIFLMEPFGTHLAHLARMIL